MAYEIRGVDDPKRMLFLLDDMSDDNSDLEENINDSA